MARMAERAVIQAAGLRKLYGPTLALDQVDLEVRPGEIFGFLGPNGAGKTTTIRCMLDLIRPSAGELRVLGLDPQGSPSEVRARTGYLPGELHLDESLSAEATFRFLLRLRRGRPDWTYINQLVGRIDLDPRTPIRNLSKGNKQKVGVVQALMHRPELLLLDEPTSGLDPLVHQTVLSILQEARRAGTTIFLSSHNLAEVEAVADRVGIIRQGKVIEVLQTELLHQRALRRAHVRFQQAVDTSALERVPGVRILSKPDGTRSVYQVEGEVSGFLKALADLPVADLELERPSLEEVFLAYYADRPGES